MPMRPRNTVGVSSVTVTVTVEGTLSRTADSDGGGVPDWVELILGTDPTDPADDPLYQDSDGGGVPDWIEIIQGTDPTNPDDDLVDLDTDGGGVPDWIEIFMGTDINNPADDPLDVDTDGNGIPDWHEFATCGSVGCVSHAEWSARTHPGNDCSGRGRAGSRQHGMVGP